LSGVVSPCRQDLSALIQIVFPDLVKRVRLAVMGLWVFRKILDTVKSRHSRVIKGSVIGSETAGHARLKQFQFTQGGKSLVHHFARLIIVVKTQCADTAGAGIVNQHARDFLQLIPMRFNILCRADEAFLFPTEQNESDGAVRSEIQFCEGPRRFQHGHRPGPIVSGARTQIPGIQVRSEKHDFVGFFASAKFRDGVVNVHRLVAKSVGHFDFNFHFSVLLHAEEHAVTLTGNEGCGNRANVKLLAANAGHVEQAVRLGGIAQNCGNAFLFEKFIACARHVLKRQEGRRSGRLAFSRRRRLQGMKQDRVGTLGTRRREAFRLLVNHDSAFQLGAKLLEFILRFRIEIDQRTAHNPVGSRRPTRGSDGQRMLRWTDDTCACQASCPGMRDGPGLQLYVR